MEPTPAEFDLLEANGQVAEHGAGPCSIEVDAEARTAALQITGPAPFRLDFDDVDAVAADGDIAVRISLAGGLVLRLTRLGNRCEQLLRELRTAWRDHAVERLRLGEATPPVIFEAEVTRGGKTSLAELRVHATRLTVLPEQGEPFAQPLGALGQVAFDEASYSVDFTASEGAWRAGKLGKQTDPFLRLVEERRGALHTRGQKALAQLLPSYDSLTLRRIGALLPDGAVASAGALDAIKPGTFAALAHAAAATNALEKSLAELQQRAKQGEAAVCIAESRSPSDVAEEPPPAEPDAGEEQGEPGPPPNPALEGRTIGLVFPLADGKVLAVEVGGHAGKATYLFRATNNLTARQLLADWGQLDFKREPLYLAEDKLCAGPHGSWRMALRRSEPLKRLRAAFLGRVAHGSAWSKNLDKQLEKAG